MGVGVPILVALGVLPTIFIFWRINSNSPVQKVPLGKLLKVFFISMLSVIPAAILELIGRGIFQSAIGTDSHLYYIFVCIGVIALSEEGCKYFSFKWMIFNDRHFSNTYDGLFYGAAAALGFATLENIMYIFSNNGLTTALLRMFLSVPGHAATGIFMGYYFGVSKYKKYNNIHEDINPQRRAYFISVLLHGLFDFFLMDAIYCVYLENYVGAMLDVLGFVAVMITEYVIMIKTVRRGKRESFNIYNRHYYENMNGAVQDMMGKTNEHLVKMPAYNYNTVGGAPMQPGMPPMNNGYPQPGMVPMNNGYPQPGMVPMNNGYPQLGMAPVNNGYPQPGMALVNNGLPQPGMAPMNNGFPQSGMQPVNSAFAQPSMQPVARPMNNGLQQPNVSQQGIGTQQPVMTASPEPPVSAPTFSENNMQEEMQQQQAFMNQLHKPVNRQIDVIFDDPDFSVCPQCGTKCEKNSRFCIICGTKLAE